MDVIVNPEVIPHNVTYAFLASAILIAAALAVRGSIQLVPKGIQNFMEMLVDAIWKLVDENIDHHWSRQLFPFIMTIFLFILLCNFMGLVPGFASPTSNVNTNAAMAIPVFLATPFLRDQGSRRKIHQPFSRPYSLISGIAADDTHVFC